MVRHRALVFCVALAVVACSSDEVDTNGDAGGGGTTGGSAGLGGGAGSGAAGSGGVGAGSGGGSLNEYCGYGSPGCGTAAPKKICRANTGGALGAPFCGCTGMTIIGSFNAGLAPEPWTHKGFCLDAGTDSGMDSG